MKDPTKQAYEAEAKDTRSEGEKLIERWCDTVASFRELWDDLGVLGEDKPAETAAWGQTLWIVGAANLVAMACARGWKPHVIGPLADPASVRHVLDMGEEKRLARNSDHYQRKTTKTKTRVPAWFAERMKGLR